jgi:hypothetical protein
MVWIAIGAERIASAVRGVIEALLVSAVRSVAVCVCLSGEVYEGDQ